MTSRACWRHVPEESLGLPRPGTGRHHQVATGGGLAQRLLLVPVERAVQRQLRPAEPREPGIQHALANELPQTRAGAERGVASSSGPLASSGLSEIASLNAAVSAGSRTGSSERR